MTMEKGLCHTHLSREHGIHGVILLSIRLFHGGLPAMVRGPLSLEDVVPRLPVSHQDQNLVERLAIVHGVRRFNEVQLHRSRGQSSLQVRGGGGAERRLERVARFVGCMLMLRPPRLRRGTHGRQEGLGVGLEVVIPVVSLQRGRHGREVIFLRVVAVDRAGGKLLLAVRG